MNTTIKYLKTRTNYENLKADFLTVKESSLILRAFDNKVRQSILKLLESQGPTSVNEISTTLAMGQSEASQHLGILRRACILTTRREGKYIIYDLNHYRLSQIEAFVRKLLNTNLV